MTCVVQHIDADSCLNEHFDVRQIASLAGPVKMSLSLPIYLVKVLGRWHSHTCHGLCFEE